MTGHRSSAERTWSVPLAIHQVPKTGRRIELAADERARANVAALAGLRALPRLEAVFDVTLAGRAGLRVLGRVAATVGQTCVVTLEPIETEIEEMIDLVFAPPAAAAEPELARAADLESGGTDAPEPLVGGGVDLGAIATEFLLLAIDPYPRRPDAVFEGPAGSEGIPKPFAALAALKKGRGGSQG